MPERLSFLSSQRIRPPKEQQLQSFLVPLPPHTLFLGSHVSNKSLEVIELAGRNGITLDALHHTPPVCCSYMLDKKEKRITDYNVARLFNNAHMTAASMKKGISGFECTGIFSLNRDQIIVSFCTIFDNGQQHK